jgi:hypothetical protein
MLCGSDELASGVLVALDEMGRRVPDDVAVTGYDNWRAMFSGAEGSADWGNGRCAVHDRAGGPAAPMSMVSPPSGDTCR